MAQGILLSMSDQIFVNGKDYTASKKAALASGYAQDYIGQLARSGMIDAQRVGGLWYVSMESLDAYKKNTAQFTPSLPVERAQKEADTIVSFDGKDYVSASRAAKITGYNQDYVGQLARGGKILSRQVGNRWYVERDGLLAHKSSKDALLAAVQSEAVGISKPLPVESTPSVAPDPTPVVPFYTYTAQEHSPLPTLMPKREKELAVPNVSMNMTELAPMPQRSHTSTPLILKMPQASVKTNRSSGISSGRAIKAVAAATVVIVLSYGMITLKSNSSYAALFDNTAQQVSQFASTAGAAAAVDSVGDFLEKLLVPERVYIRAKDQ